MKTMSIPRGARILVAALVVAVVAIPVGRAANATAFSKIVVFGDSLNDRSNMVQFTGGIFPNAPTYTYGRQTNGQVWVEYLAARLGMAGRIKNYAVVGALTRATPAFPTGNVWSDTFPGLEGTDVATQVTDYLGDVHGKADPEALFVLEGGANDFPRVADPTVIVSNLIGSLIALETHGARNIVLVNLPDIGKTPRVILAEMFGYLPPGTAGYLSSVCARLNQALAAAAEAVTPECVKLTMADIDGFMDAVTGNPAAFGLAEVTLPYLMSDGSADPATFLFWDDLHPTTRGHEILADYVLVELLNAYSHRKGDDEDRGGEKGRGDDKGKNGTAERGPINGLHGLVKNPR